MEFHLNALSKKDRGFWPLFQDSRKSKEAPNGSKVMNVLVIEDELITALHLIESIKYLRPDYSVVKVIGSVDEASLFLKENQTIDLIFSDIHLSDGLSFMIFQEVEVKIPIIFCTAFDRYFMEAFNTYGIAYILKPFDSKKLKTCIEKFEGLVKNKSAEIQRLPKNIENLKFNTSSNSILIHQNEKIIPVLFEDIAIIWIDHGVVKLTTFDNRTFIPKKSLDDFEKLLNSKFYRINRQYIVQRRAVKDTSQYVSRKLLVNLHVKFAQKITIGKEKTPNFLKWLSSN